MHNNQHEYTKQLVEVRQREILQFISATYEYKFYISKILNVWSSSGASPQTLYHVSVGSTRRSTTWLSDSYSMICNM